MAYGRRTYRRKRRVTRKRRKYSRSRPRRKAMSKKRSYSRKRSFRSKSGRKRRTTRKRRKSTKRGHFKAIPKAVRRAGTLACPVVYECLKKLADSNDCYAIKRCAGIVESTVDSFGATTTTFDADQGPASLGTAEVMPACGLFGINIYANPVEVPSAGLSTTLHTPGTTAYREIPWDFHVFPLLAMTNPTATAPLMNENNCRTNQQCTIISWDNRHRFRIQWAAIDTTSAEEYQSTYKSYFMMHEVVWWVPDLSTVEDNGLVATDAGSDTVAETQVLLRLQRQWLKQMYNAYFVNHPIDDASIIDEVDIVTGPPVNAFDTFNEPDTAANPENNISMDNLGPSFRDSKEYMANGVLDRRKDAKPVWNRKKFLRRPRARGSFHVHENGGTGGVVNEVTSVHRAGKLFQINKKMQWEKTAVDATPDTNVRDVCPRGCYVYIKYFYYNTGMLSGTTQAITRAPTIRIDLTNKVDRTHRLKWVNI